jgi:hypothetical protein
MRQVQQNYAWNIQLKNPAKCSIPSPDRWLNVAAGIQFAVPQAEDLLPKGKKA